MNSNVQPKKCVICDTQSATVVMQSPDYQIVKCSSCGLIYQNSINRRPPSDGMYDNIHESRPINAGNRSDCEVLDEAVSDAYRQELFKEIKNEHPNAGSFLDVGCSYGFLVAVFARQGWRAYGIDFCKPAVEWARSQGLNCEVSSVEAFEPREKFDVIVMSHVIEHCEDPLSVVRKVGSWLSNGGTLHIRTPNAGSWFVRPGGFGFRGQAKPFEHLYYFSPETLSRLLVKAGFVAVTSVKVRYSIGDLVNTVLRSMIVRRSSWIQSNYGKPIQKKQGYTRLKAVYERMLRILTTIELGPDDRELRVVARRTPS